LLTLEVRANIWPCAKSESASHRTYTGLSDGAYVFLVQSVTLTAILGPATETDFAIDTTGPVLTNFSVTVGCGGHCSSAISVSAPYVFAEDVITLAVFLY